MLVFRQPGLYLVEDIQKWYEAPSPNSEGLHKVFQIGHFPGQYRGDTEDTKYVDLRPAKSCPCVVNLQARSYDQLLEFVIRA